MNPFAISYFDRDMGCDTVFYNIMKRKKKSHGFSKSYVNTTVFSLK